MRKEDYSIFEYRMQKDMINVEAVINERLNGNFEKYSIRTETVGHIDISIYRPSIDNGKEFFPAVFSFHGGGFVLGYYEMDGKYCRRLADATGCAIINVDYCLAPEFKFPKAILSSYEVISYVKRHAQEYRIDENKIMVMGHSAGGNIAVDMCLLDKEKKEVELKGLIANYAPLRQSISEEDRKAKDPSKAISRNRMLQYIHWYFDDLDDLNHPLASPAIADLENLPQTLILSAELDSLCDEEREFAEKAKQAGVDVLYEVFQGCQHGFTHQELKEYNHVEAERAWNLMSTFIKNVFFETN